MQSYSFDWKENAKGNHVGVYWGDLKATIFPAEQKWQSIVNGRLLKAAFDTADDAKAAAEKAYFYPDDELFVVDDRWMWKANKDGNGWHIKVPGKGIITVKQCKTSAWYAASAAGPLPIGAPRWFSTPEQAKRFVKETYKI